MVEVWELHLAIFKNTVKFARRAQGELDRFDIDILNVGLLTNPPRLSTSRPHQTVGTLVDDCTRLQISVISTSLLAVPLLPLLLKNVEARLQFKASNPVCESCLAAANRIIIAIM